MVGLDADPAHAAMAAGFAAGQGLGGVEIMTGDARSTGLPPGSFDLVHARTLLVNLPEPGEVAAEMTRLARRSVQLRADLIVPGPGTPQRAWSCLRM